MPQVSSDVTKLVHVAVDMSSTWCCNAPITPTLPTGAASGSSSSPQQQSASPQNASPAIVQQASPPDSPHGAFDDTIISATTTLDGNSDCDSDTSDMVAALHSGATMQLDKNGTASAAIHPADLAATAAYGRVGLGLPPIQDAISSDAPHTARTQPLAASQDGGTPAPGTKIPPSPPRASALGNAVGSVSGQLEEDTPGPKTPPASRSVRRLRLTPQRRNTAGSHAPNRAVSSNTSAGGCSEASSIGSKRERAVSARLKRSGRASRPPKQ